MRVLSYGATAGNNGQHCLDLVINYAVAICGIWDAFGPVGTEGETGGITFVGHLPSSDGSETQDLNEMAMSLSPMGSRAHIRTLVARARAIIRRCTALTVSASSDASKAAAPISGLQWHAMNRVLEVGLPRAKLWLPFSNDVVKRGGLAKVFRQAEAAAVPCVVAAVLAPPMLVPHATLRLSSVQGFWKTKYTDTDGKEVEVDWQVMSTGNFRERRFTDGTASEWIDGDELNLTETEVQRGWCIQRLDGWVLDPVASVTDRLVWRKRSDFNDGVTWIRMQNPDEPSSLQDVEPVAKTADVALRSNLNPVAASALARRPLCDNCGTLLEPAAPRLFSCHFSVSSEKTAHANTGGPCECWRCDRCDFDVCYSCWPLNEV